MLFPCSQTLFLKAFSNMMEHHGKKNCNHVFVNILHICCSHVYCTFLTFYSVMLTQDIEHGFNNVAYNVLISCCFNVLRNIVNNIVHLCCSKVVMCPGWKNVKNVLNNIWSRFKIMLLQCCNKLKCQGFNNVAYNVLVLCCFNVLINRSGG